VDIVRERAFDRFGRLPEEQAHKFKYPFDIQANLLWSLRPFPEPKIESIIRDHVDSRAIDCVYFTNPPVLRSVPNVSHVHIMTHPRSPPHLEI
jgi:hypothetical protein